MAAAGLVWRLDAVQGTFLGYIQTYIRIDIGSGTDTDKNKKKNNGRALVSASIDIHNPNRSGSPAQSSAPPDLPHQIPLSATPHSALQHVPIGLC